MSGRVQGKIALVSGAGGGIGRASCLALAREGAAVIATDIDRARADETAALCQQAGARALAFAHDVTKEPEWVAIVDQASSALGGLDILVNNAGVALPTPLLDPTLDAWRKTLDVNLDGVFLGLRAALRVMQTRADESYGSIINISSIYGLVGSANIAGYSASKGAVRLLTKSAALECATRGWRVRVNSIHPGYIETPMVMGALAHGGAEAQAARIRELTAAHPIGRMGRPEDIANGVLYLASDEASFVTGAELVIDGGFTAR
jgi:NAD(P)-dependent dehydrogenase (short-subunit alcohol dehydrogenase family)